MITRLLRLLGAPRSDRREHPTALPPNALLAAGIAAGLLFDGATLGFRHLTGAPSFPEDVSDLTIPYIPADLFGRLLSELGPHGKEILVIVSLVGAGLAIVGLTVAYGLLVCRGWHRVRLAVSLWLAASIGLWVVFGPVLDANDAGGTLLVRRTVGILTLWASVAVATAAVFVMLRFPGRALPLESGGGEMRWTVSRRRLLGGAAGISGGLVLGGGGLAAALASFRGATNLDYEGRGLTPDVLNPITANEDFYVVSKNIIDPSVDASSWRLEMKGLVSRPATLQLEDLSRLPQHDQVVTLECISNGAGGTLISTARWSGPRLADVVALAGKVDLAARYAVVSAVDGYYDSLTREEALAPSTLVALRMNGSVLPDRHGFPARLIVPGRYGEKQMKWLSAVEFSRDDYKGFYQREGWSEAGVVRTFSRINRPVPGDRLHVGVPVTVTGLAYAGTRGISRVEVSADGGATWSDAQLDPPISEYAWRFWGWRWTPVSPARYTLTVRATDGTGALQTKDDYSITPAGAAAWHSIAVFGVG
jgi:DMSO/TMAO reductase YedYZ molybdopterin-dependent catalytic subunit